MRRLVVTCLAATLLTGCGMDGGGDPLQVTDTLVAATPATSPPVTADPAGTTTPAPPVQHLAYDPATRTLVAATGNALLLRTDGRPDRTVALPSAPASLRVTDGHALTALPDTDQVVRTDLTTARTEITDVPGAPVDALDLDAQRLAVAHRDTRAVTIRQDGRPPVTSDGFTGPEQLIATGGTLHLLDSLTTSLTPVDTADGSKGPGLRAGEGATQATTDRYGRILAVDTRGGELLAFSTDPLIMKQRYPVPGAPYDIAYDPARDLAWITLTATNEVVAYDVAGGQPREVHRLPTLGQPDSVAVDPAAGAVHIGSATGGGIQVVTP
ncbi:YncE family protein [Saccharopolyspora sp. CA-218241]|uniref:YncE family protein n=1 Tax=Saccharopolyspora sp. CA-218241 TaxID=3240027 RepID=UPI003D957DDF